MKEQFIAREVLQTPGGKREFKKGSTDTWSHDTYQEAYDEGVENVNEWLWEAFMVEKIYVRD